MPPDPFLHQHPEFPDLIRIVATQMTIDPALVEKDYWIMHCLYGLQRMNLIFELKGGTSLSKGYRIIHRFSEDIDIRIEPPADMDVKTGRNHTKPQHSESRRRFYNWLAETIKVDGIDNVERATDFDDDENKKYRRGGIRMHYQSTTAPLAGLKNGILLEVGFDTVRPNSPKDISSWAYNFAADKVSVVDNRAKGVLCYHPGYTLVEKLQTISTKYRQQRANGTFPANFIRHYYDIYCLLNVPEVQVFIGTPEYEQHKTDHFPKVEQPIIARNQAFLLDVSVIRQEYEREYREKTSSLYYQHQPPFDEIMSRIGEWVGKL